MLELLLLLLLTIIAVGITYVAHLQQKLLDSQDSLINHFIDLVRVEVNESRQRSDKEFRDLLVSRK